MNHNQHPNDEAAPFLSPEEQAAVGGVLDMIDQQRAAFAETGSVAEEYITGMTQDGRFVSVDRLSRRPVADNRAGGVVLRTPGEPERAAEPSVGTAEYLVRIGALSRLGNEPLAEERLPWGMNTPGWMQDRGGKTIISTTHGTIVRTAAFNHGQESVTFDNVPMAGLEGIFPDRVKPLTAKQMTTEKVTLADILDIIDVEPTAPVKENTGPSAESQHAVTEEKQRRAAGFIGRALRRR